MPTGVRIIKTRRFRYGHVPKRNRKRGSRWVQAFRDFDHASSHSRTESAQTGTSPMWIEFGQIFDKLSYDSDVRAIVLSGAGEKAFSAGLDVQAASEGGSFAKKGDVARLAVAFRRHVDEFQKCIAGVERCEKRTFTSMNASCNGGLTVQ